MEKKSMKQFFCSKSGKVVWANPSQKPSNKGEMFWRCTCCAEKRF